MIASLVSQNLNGILPYARTETEQRVLAALRAMAATRLACSGPWNPLDDAGYKTDFVEVASADPSNAAFLLRVALMHDWLRGERNGGLHAGLQPFSVNWRAQDGSSASPAARQMIERFCANGAGDWEFVAGRSGALRHGAMSYLLPLTEIGLEWRKEPGDAYPKLYPTR